MGEWIEPVIRRLGVERRRSKIEADLSEPRIAGHGEQLGQLPSADLPTEVVQRVGRLG